MESPAQRAEALVRIICALPDAQLRAAFMRNLLIQRDVSDVAPVLEVLCARAEQAEEAAREALVALVDAIHHPTCASRVHDLRAEAVIGPHLCLERLVRQPVSMSPPRGVGKPEDDPVPDYGRGRPLTLGERKSLARRPDRDMMERLLRDPHPDVIKMVLANPKLLEEDVLNVAARRPCRPDVLTEIARQPRWAHRPRIRIALVLNPDTPLEIAGPAVGLLMRQELRLVASSPTVPPGVRALCLEHLERRPPTDFDDQASEKPLQ